MQIILKSHLLNFIPFLFFTLSFLYISCDRKKNNCPNDDPKCDAVIINKSPQFLTYLTLQLEETSGLINALGKIWTHNDSGWFDHIYEIDTASGNILKTIVLQNIENVDFEDLAQNSEYIFVGDFGNNDGSRTDFVIYHIAKNSINPDGGSIQYVNVSATTFFYPEQQTFVPGNNHNFDCEAFIWLNDYFYLFTKHRTDDNTTLYRIPAQAGNFAAEKLDVFKTGGSITGADLSPDGKELALLGYEKDKDVFIWFFTDFENENFFSGKKIYVNLGTFNEVGQAEGICYQSDNQTLLISAEKTNNTPPVLYKFPLSTVR